MTDTEIIKALECCAKPYCNDNKCPLHKKTINTKDCITQLSTNALDIINRQKAEIERLKNSNSKLKSENYKLEVKERENPVEMALLIDEQAEQIKRLKTEKDNLIRTYAECQAEAVKEFAEKLIGSATTVSFGGTHDYGLVSTNYINFLLKETVGDE